MSTIRLLRLFENIERAAENISLEIKENLDEYESIAGGECHDVALIAYTYAKMSGFLDEPVIKWTPGHAWVEGKYDGRSVIFDIVAVNQKHLGEPFSIKDDLLDEPMEINTAYSAEEYVDENQHCAISPEDAEYGAEELTFLDKFITKP